MENPERRLKIKPGIGDIPEKGIYGSSPSIDGDLMEVDEGVLGKSQETNSRQLIVGISTIIGTGGIILTGCVPGVQVPETPTVTRIPEEVGIPPSPTLEIKKLPTSTPEEPITTSEPRVSPTKKPTSPPTETPEPTPTPKPEEPVEMVATGKVGLFQSPNGERVGHYVPGQEFTLTGREEDGWLQVRDPDGHILWIKEDSPYGPVGEEGPPPSPEPTVEIKPATEICALTGECYLRTEHRKGDQAPDGGIYHWAKDPDPTWGGHWTIAGRVIEIIDEDTFLLNAGKGNVLKVTIQYDSPYFTARAWRIDAPIGTPMEKARVHIVPPKLGSDIIPGDYVHAVLNGIPNSSSDEEAYNLVISRGPVLDTPWIQIHM